MNKTTLGIFVLLLLGAGSCARKDANKTTCIDFAKINVEAVCSMQYEPVCGCNGETYSNACMAEKAGVTSYTLGSCSEAQ